MFKALAKSCGRNDDKLGKITYDTVQFTKYVFNVGDSYYLRYANGDVLRFEVSRGGKTIYSKGKLGSHSQILPTVGNKVEHHIIEISKVLKQLDAC